ncbi:hypothetical protein [uncultured Tenacibaculum sp.]|uniref:hypothetical protein n=1 Tax=uncultured Tenacibaculum sp. TaxID=174713 RepID=UPI00260980F8|nr:hypothetical protein [uncultured Tenacibaculum sp.]
MKNSTLIVRSVFVILLLAGTAQYFSYTNNQQNEAITTTTKVPIKSSDTNKIKKTKTLVGKWKVNYNSETFKGAIVYNIKKDGNTFNAYTYEYIDMEGYREKAKNKKILIITSVGSENGKGVYNIKYENNVYDVPCTIKIIDNNSFIISYDYFGYSDSETWKRL